MKMLKVIFASALLSMSALTLAGPPVLINEAFDQIGCFATQQEIDRPTLAAKRASCDDLAESLNYKHGTFRLIQNCDSLQGTEDGLKCELFKGACETAIETPDPVVYLCFGVGGQN